MTTLNSTPKRTMHNPEYFVGKRIDLSKWNLPDGYNICEKTRKFQPESALLISFDHYSFEKSWLLEKGIYVEDAAWLSQEGYDEIVDVLKAEGQYDQYVEIAFSNHNAPGAITLPATTVTAQPRVSAWRRYRDVAYTDTPRNRIERWQMRVAGYGRSVA